MANSRALLALGIALSLAACNKSPDPQTQTLQLQVISPHGSDIRREFAAAFSNWHQQHFGQPVEILYPDIGGGGTGNIVRQLDAAYAHADTSTFDVMFGGGSVAFSTFVSKNYLAPLPPLSPEELQKAWPTDPLASLPAQILDTPLRGKDNLWTAATLSTFGIEVNPDRIAELHLLDPRLTTPQTWADLAGPQWFGHLSLADPSKSGSVKTSYEMILQQHGWEKGWPILVQLFANAALIRESGSSPADDAASAEALAGICIDFYGRLQVSRVGPRAAAFIVPGGEGGGGTALDADPIALLKGAPHPQLAARFIRFVISPEGQRLWIDKPGSPGGPQKSALGRMSVLPDLYASEAPNLFDPVNPLQSPAMLKFDQALSAARNPWLGDLIKAALIDNEGALVRARRALKDAGDPPALLAQLTALPTYRPSHIENNTLTYGNEQPIGAAALPALAQEYAPPKSDPRLPYAERLQNNLKDSWRDSFAARFAATPAK